MAMRGDDLQPELDRPAGGDAVVRRNDVTIRNTGGVVHNSEAVRRLLDQVQVVAPTDATVLLLGETGVGKEVFAQAIHDASPRRRRPMIRVSCAAIPATLIERELFGHERGAFTDAWARQVGRFEAASGSTLFLDEIGELPLEMQVKLLRVLQNRTIERLGSPQPIRVDVRIIAATNRDLEQAIRERSFREDLFYRLSVFPIVIPPLRERVEDIAPLAWAFIDELSDTFGRKVDAISRDSLEELQRYGWPGNVRELRNLIEREMIVAESAILTPTMRRLKRWSPGQPLGTSPDVRSATLAEVEITYMRTVLERCGWRIRGRSGAAALLGLKPTTLESRMERLGISRDQHRAQADASGTSL